ncbi:hypothetical protein [Vibrio mangrovi]|uniref:Uncharacterized protein n=1 Tax=Vibrio mangrovi TaxID=474394 RepID=A0A1Y6J0I4_9VIBR|nr:hypothetical protein [Vibrio mangrovi]MDW6002750.1 hypothetical protein [Vibrio mangrovi]SMS02242.1 hypothetical protein VIM7927_03560 [Vibrio mangrovi]
MIEFGKEQPIANNESLYEKKCGVDELCLDQSKGRELNRYSFVIKDGELDSIPFLIREFLNQIGLRVVVVVTWLINLPGKSSVAAKVIEKRYLKQGWNICLRKDHYLAIKEVQLSEIDSWPPLAIKPLDGGLLLLVGNNIEEDILSILNEECSSFLARTRYFVPNTELFKRLESDNVSVMYQVNDNLNNTGMVLLGKHSINMMQVEYISIDTIYEGDSAYKVFV